MVCTSSSKQPKFDDLAPPAKLHSRNSALSVQIIKPPFLPLGLAKLPLHCAHNNMERRCPLACTNSAATTALGRPKSFMRNKNCRFRFVRSIVSMSMTWMRRKPDSARSFSSSQPRPPVRRKRRTNGSSERRRARSECASQLIVTRQAPRCLAVRSTASRPETML